MRVTSEMRACVERQGFVGLSDHTISDIYYWLRLSPLICGLWAFVGTLLESAMILGVLVPIAVLGAVLPRHPFDAIYTFGVQRVLGTASIPRYGAPRRFTCAVAAGFLTAAAVAFALGALWTGRVFGFTMSLVAATLVVTGFCIPSYLYAWWSRR